MPKRKRYKDLSRFQQWRRRQETDCTVNVTYAEKCRIRFKKDALTILLKIVIV